MKSMAHKIGYKVMDSAYEPKIKAIRKGTIPNFVFIEYDRENMEVRNVIIVPKYFISPDIIEKRKPLSPNARRAGWNRF